MVGQGATGPGPEDVVGCILKDHKKQIKTTNVLTPSFTKDKFQKVSKRNRWKRVIVD